MKKILLDTDASIKLTKVVELNENVSKYDDFRLGSGEKSVINYFLVNDIDLIVSDDETFLKILDSYEIPFTPVAGVILISVINGLITREKGISYLELLKPMIKDEHMFYIRSKIEGLK